MKKKKVTVRQLATALHSQNKPLLFNEDLSSFYPEDEHLIGNFIETYTDNYNMLDANVIRLYGDRALLVDKDEDISDTITNWVYEVNGLVFSHITDWAKMFSALLKDYEPLWNVDGKETTTYGKTKKTEKYADHITDVDLDGIHRENKNPLHTDTETTKKVTAPSTTERNIDIVENEFEEYTTEFDERARTNITTEQAHDDVFEEDQHTVTLERQGNIGVTKSTDLVESEILLRQKYSFFDIIFKFIIEEMGVSYYDEWNRC